MKFYIVGGRSITRRGRSGRGRSWIGWRELGIEQYVVRVPFVADTAGVYRSLDVVVHASVKPEPFGLTIAEAMACGRAVVVSRGVGRRSCSRTG